MNRRNMIKGTLGATTVTLVPGAVVAGSLSRDLSNSSELNAEKWELAFRLSKMPGECDPISVGIAGLGLTKDHRYRESFVAAFDAGESFDEAYARICSSEGNSSKLSSEKLVENAEGYLRFWMA